MEWSDVGIVLGARAFGESSKIVDVLTREHGRCAGLVRGARSKAMRAVLQPANAVRVRWRARLEDQLGTFQVELSAGRAGVLVETAHGAFGVQAMTALLRLLAERDPHPRLHDTAGVVLDHFDGEAEAGEAMIRFELAFLDEMGFGLDLTRCAATGAREDLVYVSPKTGRAVSRAAGAPWADRLLPLPAFLLPAGEGEGAPADAAGIADGFRLTGHFLEIRVFRGADRPLPPERARFVERIVRALSP